MPGLQALHERFGARGLRVLAASIDGRGADPAVRAFGEELGLTFTLLHDPDERVVRAFRTAGVPEAFLIDREGRIAARWIGAFDPLDPAVASRIERVLAGAG
jgi:peroxiredoxin